MTQLFKPVLFILAMFATGMTFKCEACEFGCKPFVDCMPVPGGWDYIRGKK